MSNVATRPDWLDDKFVKTCIKNDLGLLSIDKIRVHDVEVQYAVGKGENYTSVILRLVVKADVNCSQKLDANGNVKLNGNFTQKDYRYIIKVPNKDDLFELFLNELQTFAREVYMYQDIIPKFQNILKDVGLDTTFCCRCLHVYEEKCIIVMDDLKVQNYVMANRIKGADLEHTKLSLLKLAKFHAASMKYYEETSFQDLPKYYFKGLICKYEDDKINKVMDNILGRTMFTKKIAELAENLEKKPGYEEEADIISKLTDHGYDILCDTFTFKKGNTMNALLHGDYWLNNMLFKYDDNGNPIDVMMLDLQCAYVNTVANEFMYFFLSSTSDEVRESHYDHMVQFYYKHLIETLNKVRYKGVRPTLQELHDELVISSSVQFFVLTYMLPLLKNEFTDAHDRSESESTSIEEVTKQSKLQQANPVYLKTLFTTVDLFRSIGVFEYQQQLIKVYNK